MKKVLLRVCAVFLAITMLIPIAPMSAFALSAQQQEDIYRVDTWWQDEYNQQFIDWLLESDNFLYHLDITTGNIIHDISYESLNIDPIERKDNFVEILTAIIDYSYENVREESAQESAKALTSYFFESFEEYLLNQPDEVKQTVEIIGKATNLAAQDYLDRVYVINEELTQLSYDQMYEYIEKYITQETLHSDALSHFEAFKTSSDWLKKWNAYSTMFSIVGESINIVTDSFDIAVELESYQKTDEKFVELLKYIHSITTDPALKAACVEIYTKLSNDYEDNFVSEFVERVGEGAVNITLGILKDCAADANIYVRCITLGYDAGTLVSNWFFNTDDTKKHMQSIYCLNEVAEIIVPVLQNELSNSHYYDSPGEFSAKYAADTIYHMQVLICLRRLGEESYYNLKDSVYSSLMVKAVNVLPWVSSEENEQIIEDWHKQFLTVIDAVEGSLYKMLPAYHYYKKPEPAEFECEGSRLISYNGNSVNVYIPATTKYNTIDSYAFNGNETIESVNIPHTIKTINENAFYNCTNFKSVTLNSTEAVIVDGAFVNCHKDFTIYGYNNSTAQTYAVANDINFVALDNKYENAQDYVDSDFVIEDGVLVDYLGDGGDVYIPYGVTEIDTWFTENITSVVIPDTVLAISGSAFWSCYTLETVYIGKGLSHIVGGAFSSCRNLRNFIVSEDNNQFSSFEGVLYNKEKTELVCFPGGRTSYTFTKSIKSIARYAFAGSMIDQLVIPNGVMNIARYAFWDCDNMVNVTIGNSVTDIGDSAFSSCDNLEAISVTDDNNTFSSTDGILYNKNKTVLLCCPAGKVSCEIPNSVIKIADRAFYDCWRLTNISITDNVVAIGDEVFSNCGSLKNVTIGKGLKEIDAYNFLFDYCFSLENIYVANENQYFSSVDGVLYNKSQTILIRCPPKKSMVNFVATVTTIEEGAFSRCAYLTSLVIPVTVASIGDSAFWACENLERIIILDSLSNAGDSCFGCCHSNLVIHCTEDSYIDKYASDNSIEREYHSWAVREDIVSCEKSGFICTICGKLGSSACVWSKEWTEDVAPSCTTAGSKSYHCIYCDTKKDITEIPAGHIWADNWTIDIREKCTAAGSKSRHCLYCAEKTDITEIPAAHAWSSDWTIDVQPTCSTTGIKSHHCLNCDEKVDITTIAILATAHTWSTEWTVDIEETCTTVGRKSHHCLNCEEKTDVTEITAVHKWSDEWTVDVVPTETTEGSQSRHCTRCDEKTDITVIPMLSTESPATDFEYSIRNNEVTITGYIGTSGVMNIPAYIEDCPVTTISSFAFSSNTTITIASIPYTVTEMGYYAFYNCTELIEVNLGSGMTELPENLFSNCSKLQKVSLPTGLKTIRTHAFYYCESLVEMAIPDTVEVIEDSAFYECLWYQNIIEDTVVGTGILLRLNTEFSEDVIIPVGVHTIYTCIGQNAFTNTYVAQVTIPASLIHWDAANLWIDALKLVVDENNPVFVSVDGTLYTKDMATIVAIPTRRTGTFNVPDTVTIIGEGAFYRSDLSEVVLSDGILEIGEDAFCLTSAKVALPNTVTTIGKSAFGYNEAITEIVIPSSVTTLEGWTFNNCISLASITISNSVIRIGAYTFNGCTSLISITIPKSVTSIGHEAFGGCNNLIINGYTGSFAETYAAENNIPFVALDTPITEVCEHSYDNDCDIDCNRCGDTRTVPDHSYGDDNVCDECGHKDVVLGDIDGTGEVDLSDVNAISRYLAGWDEDINEAALDINGDGAVNLKDVVYLARYVAGWEGYVLN